MRVKDLCIPQVVADTFYRVDSETLRVSEYDLFMLSSSGGWGYAIYNTELEEVSKDDEDEWFSSQEEAEEFIVKTIPKLWQEQKKEIQKLNRELLQVRTELRNEKTLTEALRQENDKLQLAMQGAIPVDGKGKEV